MEIIEAKYIKTGEHYRLFGRMYGNLGGDSAELYISGGVDENGSATIDIFDNYEDAYNSDPFSPDLPDADGYVDTAYIEQGAWVYEICKKAFMHILAHGSPDDDDAFEACMDFGKLIKYYREECV